ncbi:hypothetical protein SLEP1_g53045 [Rubroshorea leprosula]|uniref:Uncharacterized protein n=1 Tax=Rubroshorea leprosula TaxID=152421 RepID=A0AAV5M8D0_9ROSI|nr:hypothetical protein SLEP1_g53045 [Rubroshorea leprosula]
MRCFLTEEKRWSETPLENLFPIQAVKSKAGALKDTATRNLTKDVGCGEVLKFSYNAEESKWLEYCVVASVKSREVISTL